MKASANPAKPPPNTSPETKTKEHSRPAGCPCSHPAPPSTLRDVSCTPPLAPRTSPLAPSTSPSHLTPRTSAIDISPLCRIIRRTRPREEHRYPSVSESRRPAWNRPSMQKVRGGRPDNPIHFATSPSQGYALRAIVRGTGCDRYSATGGCYPSRFASAGLRVTTKAGGTTRRPSSCNGPGRLFLSAASAG